MIGSTTAAAELVVVVYHTTSILYLTQERRHRRRLLEKAREHFRHEEFVIFHHHVPCFRTRVGSHKKRPCKRTSRRETFYFAWLCRHGESKLAWKDNGCNIQHIGMHYVPHRTGPQKNDTMKKKGVQYARSNTQKSERVHRRRALLFATDTCARNIAHHSILACMLPACYPLQAARRHSTKQGHMYSRRCHLPSWYAIALLHVPSVTALTRARRNMGGGLAPPPRVCFACDMPLLRQCVMVYSKW